MRQMICREQNIEWVMEFAVANETNITSLRLVMLVSFESTAGSHRAWQKAGCAIVS